MKKSDYFNACDNYKKIYNDEFLRLKSDYFNVLKNYNYEGMRSIMNRHNMLICKTIKNVLGYYTELNDIDNLIILTGSLARKTNLLYSDIDINIMYDNKYRDKYLEIENQISYMLTQILGFRGRDRIHGITYYLPMISNSMLDEIQNNHYKLHFDDENFEYSVRDNAFDTMYNTLNSTRSINDLTEYLIAHQTDFKNWANVYKNLGDTKAYNKFHKIIKNAESEKIHLCDFELEKDKILNIFSNFEIIDNKGEIPINVLKRVYKEEPLKSIYEFMIYMYKMAVKEHINIERLDFDEMQDRKILQYFDISDNIYDYMYNYFALVTKLQYSLDTVNIDLSKRNFNTINNDRLNSIAFELFHDSDLTNELSSQKKEIASEIKKILIRR